MNRQQVDEYIIKTTGNFPELKEYENRIYIKWDGMPYLLREYIFSLSDYDDKSMIGLERDCGCGMAYFYDAIKFYLYLKNWKELDN